LQSAVTITKTLPASQQVNETVNMLDLMPTKRSLQALPVIAIMLDFERQMDGDSLRERIFVTEER
jgi:hypothetical protein